MSGECGGVSPTTHRVVLYHTLVSQDHVVVSVTVGVVLVLRHSASPPEDASHFRSKPAHTQHVNQGVNQGVESYRDDVRQQPDVLLEEVVGVVDVQEVLACPVDRHNVPGVVEEHRQVKDDVDEGDDDDRHRCFLLHLGDGGRATGDSNREEDHDGGGDAAGGDGDYGERELECREYCVRDLSCV